MLNREGLQAEARRLLNHLYDADVLRTSPLASWLTSGVPLSPEQLRAALERAIDALRPAEGIPPDAGERRLYTILRARYLDRLTQQAVAIRLGITTRHLRREQERAIEVLTDYLVLSYDLYADEDVARVVMPPAQIEVNREMLWLADSQRDQLCHIADVLVTAEQLARAIADDHSVSISVECPRALPPASMPEVVLRQIVLNVLIAMIGAAPVGGRVLVTVAGRRAHLAVSIATVADGQGDRAAGLDSAVSMSRQLTELFGGRLIVKDIDGLIALRIAVPSFRKMITVLAIEDNADTLQLWTRYVQGTRYSLLQEPDPACAIERAVKVRPALILLDVMMPGTDGWELLRKLREQPETASIPVVICTVLPQQELAASLGASGFMRKPATGKAFREMLARQTVAEKKSEC